VLWRAYLIGLKMYLLPVDSHHVVLQRIPSMMIKLGLIKRHLFLIIKRKKKRKIKRKKEIQHMLNCNLTDKRQWKLAIRKKKDLPILIERKKLMITRPIGNHN